MKSRFSWDTGPWICQWGIILTRLIEMRIPLCVSSFLGILDGIKRRKRAGYRHPSFSASCSEGAVTNYFNLPSPWLLFHDGLTLQPWAKVSPFLLKLPLSGYFDAATRKETKTEALPRISRQAYCWNIFPNKTRLQSTSSVYRRWFLAMRETCYHQRQIKVPVNDSKEMETYELSEKEFKIVILGKLNKPHQETI